MKNSFNSINEKIGLIIFIQYFNSTFFFVEILISQKNLNMTMNF